MYLAPKYLYKTPLTMRRFLAQLPKCPPSVSDAPAPFRDGHLVA